MEWKGFRERRKGTREGEAGEGRVNPLNVNRDYEPGYWPRM